MLHDYGISLNEPSGWHTRFYRIVSPVTSPVTVQAATVPFVDSDLSTFQVETCAQLGPKDALLIALVYEPVSPAQVWAPSVVTSFAGFSFRPGDFGQIMGLPANQVQARRTFTVANRVCELIACFGSDNPDIGTVNTIIASLRTLRVREAASKEANGQAAEVVFPMNLP